MSAQKSNEEIFDEAVTFALAGVNDFREKHGEPMFCGFAWVVIPGNTSFGKWLVKNEKGRKGYPSGIHVWYSTWSSSQSMYLAEVGAENFSRVLTKYGIKNYVGSRAD